MLSLACHQCQCLRGKYQCRHCFYILTIKAAYHHGSLKGLEMTHWRKVEKILQHFLRFKESRPTICLQCWASGEGHFHYSRVVRGKHVVVLRLECKTTGLLWFPANQCLWSLLVVFVRLYFKISDVRFTHVQSYNYRREQCLASLLSKYIELHVLLALSLAKSVISVASLPIFSYLISSCSIKVGWGLCCVQVQD